MHIFIKSSLLLSLTTTFIAATEDLKREEIVVSTPDSCKQEKIKQPFDYIKMHCMTINLSQEELKNLKNFHSLPSGASFLNFDSLEKELLEAKDLYNKKDPHHFEDVKGLLSRLLERKRTRHLRMKACLEEVFGKSSELDEAYAYKETLETEFAFDYQPLIYKSSENPELIVLGQYHRYTDSKNYPHAFSLLTPPKNKSCFQPLQGYHLLIFLHIIETIKTASMDYIEGYIKSQKNANLLAFQWSNENFKGWKEAIHDLSKEELLKKATCSCAFLTRDANIFSDVFTTWIMGEILKKSKEAVSLTTLMTPMFYYKISFWPLNQNIDFEITTSFVAQERKKFIKNVQQPLTSSLQKSVHKLRVPLPKIDNFKAISANNHDHTIRHLEVFHLLWKMKYALYQMLVETMARRELFPRFTLSYYDNLQRRPFFRTLFHETANTLTRYDQQSPKTMLHFLLPNETLDFSSSQAFQEFVEIAHLKKEEEKKRHRALEKQKEDEAKLKKREEEKAREAENALKRQETERKQLELLKEEDVRKKKRAKEKAIKKEKEQRAKEKREQNAKEMRGKKKIEEETRKEQLKQEEAKRKAEALEKARLLKEQEERMQRKEEERQKAFEKERVEEKARKVKEEEEQKKRQQQQRHEQLQSLLWMRDKWIKAIEESAHTFNPQKDFYKDQLANLEAANTAYLKGIIEDYERDHPLSTGEKAKDVMAFMYLGSRSLNLAWKISDFEFFVMTKNHKMEYVLWVSELLKEFKKREFKYDNENFFPPIFEKGAIVEGSILAIGTPTDFALYPKAILERDKRLKKDGISLTMHDLSTKIEHEEEKSEDVTWSSLVQKAILPHGDKQSPEGVPYFDHPNAQFLANFAMPLLYRINPLFFGNETLVKTFFSEKQRTLKTVIGTFKLQEREKENKEIFDAKALSTIQFLYQKFHAKHPFNLDKPDVRNSLYRPLQIMLTNQNLFEKMYDLDVEKFHDSLRILTNYIAYLRVNESGYNRSYFETHIQPHFKALIALLKDGNVTKLWMVKE